MNNNNIFLFFLLIGIIFFVFYLPIIDNENLIDQNNFKEKFDSLTKIDKNICSQQCCKFTQWPVPFNTSDPNSTVDYSKYIGSNFSCNSSFSGGGCLCIDKNDYNFLGNHGQDLTNMTDNIDN
jgi:hypothetical protein